tara:strand:- start:5482 stop:6213 length:732 start_codon:yes stop_codon:yes gene_type:complete
MVRKKVLILSPHPDDEIFAFPFINADFLGASSISVLFFIESSIRKKEAQRSCILNNWEALFISDWGYKFFDSLIHLDYKNLNNILQKIFADYEIIFSPLIEGGHQDHDTIGFCTLKNLENFKNKKIYFYPTYTSYGKLGLFTVMHSNNYSNSIFKELEKEFKHRPLKTFYYIFFVYKSQYLSWLLISFPYVFNLLKKRTAKLYVLKKSRLSNLEIFEILNGTPLFEIHKRCKQSSWKNSLNLN